MHNESKMRDFSAGWSWESFTSEDLATDIYQIEETLCKSGVVCTPSIRIIIVKWWRVKIGEFL